jgi:hypothetical protein
MSKKTNQTDVTSGSRLLSSEVKNGTNPRIPLL